MGKKSKTARFRIQRRLGTELPGLGKAGALERRPYPPGERSGNKRKKYSDYALRLEEKQKLRCHYCLKEHQLRRFIRNAKTGQSLSWISKLAGLLERRLDNVVFRLGLAPSIPSARQLVSHGHIQVDGKRMNIPSAVLQPGQKFSLKAKSEKNQIVITALQNPRMEAPDFLKKEEKNGNITGTVLSIPGVEYIPFNCDTGLLTEYYAARKA